MKSKLLVACVFLVLLAYMASVDACGFPMGGGCGCGCGRRKREISQYPTEQSGSSPSLIIPADRNEEILPCPQKEWLPLLTRNMNSNARQAASDIKQALYQKYSSPFFVACAPKGGRAFVSNGEGYCSTENSQLSCHAVAILG